MDITDLPRIYEFQWLLSEDHAMYAEPGGLFILWSPTKRKHVTITPIGMTREEILKAIELGDTLLVRTDPAPVNRKQRRKLGSLH